MRCRQCDYPLWGIRDRRCPECGLAFAPSQFLFKRSAVAYHCPHCDQPYYGTSAQGHLKPRTFTCVSCAHEIDMDEMVLTPTEGVREDRAVADQKNPWEQRKGLRFFSGWLRTSWMTVSAPRQLMRETSHRVLLGSAVWYATFSLVTMAMLGILAATFVSMLQFGGGLGPGGGLFLVSLIFAVLFYLVPLAIGVGLGIIVWSSATNGLLWLSGGGRHGWGWSALAISYGAGAAAVILVPLLIGATLSPQTALYGFLLALLAWGVSAALMLAEAQSISRIRAFIATLTPPAMGALLVVGGFFWLRGQVMGGVARATAFGGYAELQPVASALRRGLDRGDFEHPVELIASGELTAADFLLSTSQASANDIIVGGAPLPEYESLDLIQFERQIQRAIDELPNDVVAMRLGDFVFAYPGVDDRELGPRSIWIVIVWPDPDANAPPGANDMVWVGDRNGGVFPESVSRFDLSLQNQNQLRQSLGLPTIPHPSKVLHGQPATSP